MRSAGGNVTVGGVAGGDGEEGAIAVDTAGGKLVAELRESLRCAFDAYTGGGDATVTVPEGFAIPVNVHGVHGGKRVSGAVKVGRREGSSGEGSFLGAARVVGGTGDEAARKVAAAAQSATVTINTLASAGYSDAELDEGVAEIRRNHAESTRDHGGSSRPQVTIGDRLVLISAEVGEAVGSLKH